MSTFIDQIRKARASIKPWERTPDKSLKAVGKNLTTQHFPEIVTILDNLSKQREEIERDTPWDGDATDDVHFAQKEIFDILVASPIAASIIAGGLVSPFRATRFWISLALKERPHQSAVSAIQAAIQTETDKMNKRMLNEALEACSRAEPEKNKSWLDRLLGR